MSAVDEAPAAEPPRRRFAMHKIIAGDWICWSNDRTQVWRFHQHVDGAAHGLLLADGSGPVPYEERTYWRALWMPAERFEADPSGALDADRWASPWIEADWYLPTRQAAVELMLRAGAK